jgi:hypothetical protein
VLLRMMLSEFGPLDCRRLTKALKQVGRGGGAGAPAEAASNQEEQNHRM